MKAILEKISYGTNRSFGVFTFKSRKFNCPFHYHPEIELTWIVKSTGQRYVGDHIGRFAPGDLVLMGTDLPHMYINDAKSGDVAHSVVLQFRDDCLGADFLERGELKAVATLLRKARVGMVFHGQTRDRATALLNTLARQEGTGRLVTFLRLLEVLAESREFKTLASPAYSPSLALYQGERINRVCALISSKFQEGISQGEAARVAKMSGPSFCRFFKRATNRTFRAFLNEVRVGHASQQLLESDQTVAEICYASGFGTLANFNRQFLKLRGMSPRDFRRQSKFLKSGLASPLPVEGSFKAAIRAAQAGRLPPPNFAKLDGLRRVLARRKGMRKDT